MAAGTRSVQITSDSAETTAITGTLTVSRIFAAEFRSHGSPSTIRAATILRHITVMQSGDNIINAKDCAPGVSVTVEGEAIKNVQAQNKVVYCRACR